MVFEQATEGSETKLRKVRNLKQAPMTFTLWYFKETDFLRHQETAAKGTSTMNSDEEE
jgi:hypothetical protein